NRCCVPSQLLLRPPTRAGRVMPLQRFPPACVPDGCRPAPAMPTVPHRRLELSPRRAHVLDGSPVRHCRRLTGKAQAPAARRSALTRTTMEGDRGLPPIDLLISDVDGTLLRTDKSLTPVTRQ